jgi:hypothetical protein
MKTMTCRQLGGACNERFSANTFDEIAIQVSKHAREMVQQGDAAHIEAMNEMRQRMTSPEATKAWMDEKRKAFDSLPDDPGK